MYPMVHIGPAALQTAYLLWFAGFWIGLEVASRAARKHALPPGFVDSAVFWAVVAGLVAARLVFVVQYPEAYRNDWLGLISPQPESLNGPVGLAVGLAVLGWLAWRAGVAFRPLADALAPGAGIMIVALLLADLMDGNNVGLTTDLPWAVEIWDAQRHPVQLYIALPLVVAVVGVWFWHGARPFAGFDALLVGGVYVLALLVASHWFENSATVIDDFRREQVIAWVVLLLIVLLGAWWSRANSYNLNAEST